jgi:hypothetical protein
MDKFWSLFWRLLNTVFGTIFTVNIVLKISRHSGEVRRMIAFGGDYAFG